MIILIVEVGFRSFMMSFRIYLMVKSPPPPFEQFPKSGVFLGKGFPSVDRHWCCWICFAGKSPSGDPLRPLHPPSLLLCRRRCCCVYISWTGPTMIYFHFWCSYSSRWSFRILMHRWKAVWRLSWSGRSEGFPSWLLRVGLGENTFQASQKLQMVSHVSVYFEGKNWLRVIRLLYRRW